MPNPKYDEDDSMSNMNYPSMESSSESKLRSGATSRESYSEQKLRKNAKPTAKAKPKAKPVVGRAGAQTPGQRAKLAPRGTPMRPTKPVGDRGMDARLAAKKAANKGTPMRPTKAVGDRGMDARLAAKKTTTKKSGTTDPLAKFVFGVGKALSGGNRMTAAQVAAENKRRIAASKKGK